MQNRLPELEQQVVGNSTIVISERLKEWGYLQFIDLLRDRVELVPVNTEVVQ